MATGYGVTPAHIIRTGSGLYGKRFNGYFNDNFAFFDTAVEHGDAGVFNSISNFTSSPNYDNSASSYSWLWLGYFLAPATGTYTFYTASDDASWVWVNQGVRTASTVANAIVDNRGLHPVQERSGTIDLRENVLYPIKVIFGENFGGDRMTLSFAGPGVAKTSNGNGYFYGGEYLWGLIRGT